MKLISIKEQLPPSYKLLVVFFLTNRAENKEEGFPSLGWFDENQSSWTVLVPEKQNGKWNVRHDMIPFSLNIIERWALLD